MILTHSTVAKAPSGADLKPTKDSTTRYILASVDGVSKIKYRNLNRSMFFIGDLAFQRPGKFESLMSE